MKGLFLLFMVISLQLHAEYDSSLINILDTKTLKFGDKKFKEISDIAYKDSIVYAISDKGVLFRLKADIKKNKISFVELIDSKRLKDKNGKKLKKPYNDSEGLSFMKENLLISFEKVPRILLYSTKAKFIKEMKIDSSLKDISNYADENSALESVTYNEKYKIVTAPQKPLKSGNKEYHTLFIQGNIYRFSATSNITAIEFINSDELMVLEKKYKNSKYKVTISKIDISTCRDFYCEKKVLAKLKNSENFEGLSKVDRNSFLMVSDNQNKNKTTLVLFELK